MVSWQGWCRLQSQPRLISCYHSVQLVPLRHFNKNWHYFSMTLSVSKTDGNTQRHVGKERCQLMRVWTVSISIEFSSYGNVKPWLLLAERYVQSNSVNRVPTESSAQSRVHQEQDRQKLTTRVQTTYSNHFQTGFGKWIYMIWIAQITYVQASYALQFLCASQINYVRHPILVKRLVFHKPFGKIRF